MAQLEMVVIQHPKLEKVKYTVPEADAARWVKQGWTKTDETPAATQSAIDSQENLTVAQRVELGLPTTAGEDEPAPKAPAKAPAKAKAPETAE